MTTSLSQYAKSFQTSTEKEKRFEILVGKRFQSHIYPLPFNMTRAGIPRALARGRSASNQIISQKHLTFPKTRV